MQASDPRDIGILTICHKDATATTMLHFGKSMVAAAYC
jgi:hypothetical protein